ncbi:MAG: hypothetical protein B6229_06360 [Spirochaetaceae bacterium 4572_7]|nr:MAG: hypothetical protein B6229_06360 [Spirochaetaceae bacterium 4572_7]
MVRLKIRTQFLTLFIIIGLIPIFVIGGLFFYKVTETIITNSFSSIKAVQSMRKSDIEKNFKQCFSEINRLTESLEFRNLHSDLTDFFLGDISKDEYKDIQDRYKKYFAGFIQDNNDYNVYILSPDNGEVYYNYLDEVPISYESGLSRAWERAIKSDRPVFEDFSSYRPSKYLQSAFIAKTFHTSNGDKGGVVVIQITKEFISAILDTTEGIGETDESYIISYEKDSDRYELRSQLKTMGNDIYTIGFNWDSPLDYWMQAIGSSFKGGADQYVDSAGEKVLVTYNKLDIPSVDWYLISKINRNEVTRDLGLILRFIIIISFLLLLLIVALSLVISTNLTRPIIAGSDFAKGISEGDYNGKLDINRKDELGVLAKSLKEMGRTLKEQKWIRLGKEGLDDALRGVHDVSEVGTRFISFLAKHLDAQVGALYMLHEDGDLHLTSSYAFSDRSGNFNRIAIGEGLVGQAALEKNDLVYTHVPTDSPSFNYGVSSMLPTSYIVTPLIFEDELIGAFLIGITVPVTKLQRAFIKSIKSNIAILLNAAKSSSVIQELLKDAQLKQEELRVSNEELEQQALSLRLSEKELQTQQEELKVTNEELEERTGALERQRVILNDKNCELEKVSEDLENKAVDLERASQYKSEFLANMSHELRTPLNSILILSQLLAKNSNNNLDDKQIKSAKAINSSGGDLLKLINEILDLSKVESGKIDIVPELTTIRSLVDDIERIYRPTADQQEIDFSIDVDKELPSGFVTDSHRLQQILKNLITNAFKFTSKAGLVALKIRKDGESIVFDVTDSGIGIPKDKQSAIFEAFQQADGSTSRKYGGTGLGLSISRELAKLLGGTISLESVEGDGSTFTITIPLKKGSILPHLVGDLEDTPVEIHIKDDREGHFTDVKTLLIIEDDVNFAAILKEQAHDRGFKVLIAEDGETGLHFADYYRPSAIILDIGLPGIDGYSVMSRLKNDPELKHIPVHFMSGQDENLSAMKMGAIGYMMKPVSIDGIIKAFEKIEEMISSKVHKLLIVEDDTIQRESIESLIDAKDLEISGVGKGIDAYNLMKETQFDCVILDLGLEDMSGYELLDKIKEDPRTSTTPIIIYTGKDLSQEEELRLKKYAESIIIKGVKSPERLLEESSLFLHRVESSKNIDSGNSVKTAQREEVLKGKTILLVDDDMRNIFALSNILEEKDVNVIVARNGVQSVEQIKENEDIDLVLMDIMMPIMDGYEAMNVIRKLKDRDTLPIIALTANAMKGDRNKCIEAGANDYLAKPVDNDKLLSMLRVWLY